MSLVDNSNQTESANLFNASVNASTTDSGFNYTTSTAFTNPESRGCHVSGQYGIVTAIIATICIIFGILYTFFGYRFFKAIMFLTGFIFSTILVYMIINEFKILPPEGTLGCAIGAGILLGLFTMLIPQAGLFLTGFNLGVAAAAVILVIVEQFVHPESLWIPVVIFVVLGIVLGVLSLKFQKGITIIGTSVFGAAIGLAGVDYFVELSQMALYIWERVIAERQQSLCWFSWLMMGLWPVFATLGAVIQFKITGHGFDHRLALRSRREQNANLQQMRVREKRETQQTRYRHLYQARRVKGDVISQNFIQSIQHKLSPAMQSLTALNTEPSNEEESTATTTLTHVT